MLDGILRVFRTDLSEWHEYRPSTEVILQGGQTAPAFSLVMRRVVDGRAEYRDLDDAERFAEWDSWQW